MQKPWCVQLRRLQTATEVVRHLVRHSYILCDLKIVEDLFYFVLICTVFFFKQSKNKNFTLVIYRHDIQRFLSFFLNQRSQESTHPPIHPFPQLLIKRNVTGGWLDCPSSHIARGAVCPGPTSWACTVYIIMSALKIKKADVLHPLRINQRAVLYQITLQSCVLKSDTFSLGLCYFSS